MEIELLTQIQEMTVTLSRKLREYLMWMATICGDPTALQNADAHGKVSFCNTRECSIMKLYRTQGLGVSIEGVLTDSHIWLTVSCLCPVVLEGEAGTGRV